MPIPEDHNVIVYNGKSILVCNGHFCDLDSESPVKFCDRYKNADGDGSNPEDFAFCNDCKCVHRV